MEVARLQTVLVEVTNQKTGPLRDPEEERDNGHWLFLCFGNLANHLSRGARLIHTERLFCQEVATCSERAGAASHAYMPKFAAAALPFQVVVVAQLVEHYRVGPNISKALFAQIARDGG